jgi:hypothetical protein
MGGLEEREGAAATLHPGLVRQGGRRLTSPLANRKATRGEEQRPPAGNPPVSNPREAGRPLQGHAPLGNAACNNS